MTVVVGVDGSAGARAAIRLAAQEARYRTAPLMAVMAYSGERTLGAPATRPLATLRTAEEERVHTDATLRDIVHDALEGQADDDVEYRAVSGAPGARARRCRAGRARSAHRPEHPRRSRGQGARRRQPARAAPRALPRPGRPRRQQEPSEWRDRCMRNELVSF